MGFFIVGREHERVLNKLHELRDDIEDFGSVAFPDSLSVYRDGVMRRLREKRSDIWGGKKNDIEYRLADFEMFASDTNVIRAWFGDIKELEVFSKSLVAAKELGKDVLVFCHSKNKESDNEYVRLMREGGWLRFKNYDIDIPYLISFGGQHRMLVHSKSGEEVILSCYRDSERDLLSSFARMRESADD